CARDHGITAGLNCDYW
nr:immunoglobulin heavy chain junction region [Macaca mulatta]